MWQPRNMNGRFTSSGGWGEGSCAQKDWKKNLLIGAVIGLAVFLPVLWQEHPHQHSKKLKK